MPCREKKREDEGREAARAEGGMWSWRVGLLFAGEYCFFGGTSALRCRHINLVSARIVETGNRRGKWFDLGIHTADRGELVCGNEKEALL